MRAKKLPTLYCPNCHTLLFVFRDSEGLKGWCPFCRDEQGNPKVWKAEECISEKELK